MTNTPPTANASIASKFATSRTYQVENVTIRMLVNDEWVTIQAFSHNLVRNLQQIRQA